MSQAGKGDACRTRDFKKFRDGYSGIKWGKSAQADYPGGWLWMRCSCETIYLASRPEQTQCKTCTTIT